MANIKTKKITIDDLAGIMTSGFEKQEKITDKKIDDLAAMTKRGFDKTAKKQDLDVVKQELVF